MILLPVSYCSLLTVLLATATLLFTTNSVTSNPAALIIFAVVGGIFVNYLRRNQNDIGGGMGKDYMKEHWGIDDDK